MLHLRIQPRARLFFTMREASLNHQLPSVQWVVQEEGYFIMFTGADGFYCEDRAKTELEAIAKIISIFEENDEIHLKWNVVAPEGICHFVVSDVQVHDDVV